MGFIHIEIEDDSDSCFLSMDTDTLGAISSIYALMLENGDFKEVMQASVALYNMNNGDGTITNVN